MRHGDHPRFAGAVRATLIELPSMETDMIAGTLSIRRASVIPPLRAPPRPGPSAAAAAIMASPTARATCLRAPTPRPVSPVLPVSIAGAVRDSVPSQAFVDTFDALLDRQDPHDTSPVIRALDRTVLRFLLTYRWCATKPTPAEIADRLGRPLTGIRASLARLRRCALLPHGDAL